MIFQANHALDFALASNISTPLLILNGPSAPAIMEDALDKLLNIAFEHHIVR